MRRFVIQHQQREDIEILEVSGHMHEAEMTKLAAAIEQLRLAGHTRVIVNCYSLLNISSLGLARLVCCSESFRSRGGQIKLAGFSPPITELLHLVCLDERVECHPNVDAALHSAWGTPATVASEVGKI